MKGGRSRARLGLVSALLLSAWSPITAHATTCEATISIKGGSVLRPIFSFVGKKGGEPLQIYAITVRLKGDVVCKVATPRLDGFRPYQGDWTYGAVPPGFQTEGCEPLRPGLDYRLDLMGQCMGSLYFRTNEEKSSRPPTHVRIGQDAVQPGVAAAERVGRFAPSRVRR